MEDSLKIFADCKNKCYSEVLYDKESFHNYSYKKAFLPERVEIRKYHRYCYVSYDSLQNFVTGIPYSINFCCPQNLESVIHPIVATGLYETSLKFQYFTAQF